MKKVKIEIPIETYRGKIARVILYADMDGSIEDKDTVKKILPPIVEIVETPETAAGEET
jgi:hypothetical protein